MDKPTERKVPRRVTLQVPKDINIAAMSSEEIEKLALEVSRKAASALPKGTALGIDRVQLTNSTQADVGVWGAWCRACMVPDLSREGVVVDPAAFESPLSNDLNLQNSVKVVVENGPAEE
jgi:hypothetical protein